MFGFSHFPELIIVLVIALVIFGPKRLPELGSSLGKGIKEFRKATNELQDSIKSEPAGNLPPEQAHYTATDYAPRATTASAEYTTPTTTTTTPTYGENEPPRV